MIAGIHRADAEGKVLRVHGPATAFSIRPGVRTEWRSGQNVGQQPGGYPLLVTLRPSGEQIVVQGPSRHQPGGSFDMLDVSGARDGDVFHIALFGDDSQGIAETAGRLSVSVPIAAAAAAVSNVNPANNDGWEILPGQTGWEFHFGGVIADGDSAGVWIKGPDGVWRDAGGNNALDPFNDAVIGKGVIGSVGQRLALKGSTATQTVYALRVFGGL